MAVMSKRFFDNATEGAVCNEVLHPQFKYCTAVQLHIFKNSVKGNLQFFLAIYVVSQKLFYYLLKKLYNLN